MREGRRWVFDQPAARRSAADYAWIVCIISRRSSVPRGPCFYMPCLSCIRYALRSSRTQTCCPCCVGALGRLVLPATRTLALVEYLEPQASPQPCWLRFLRVSSCVQPAAGLAWHVPALALRLHCPCAVAFGLLLHEREKLSRNAC